MEVKEMRGLYSGRLFKQQVTKSLAWSASGSKDIQNLPFDKDLVALICDFTMQVDSGSSVAKTADNPFALTKQFTLYGDGKPIIDLYDTELLWLHHIMWGRKPDIKETPDATSQSNQSAWFRPVIPFGARRIGQTKPDYRNLSLNVQWGAIADLDGGTDFNVDSGTLKVTALKGKAEKRIFTRRHTDTLTGWGEQTIPDGRLEAIIMQVTDQTDVIDDIQLIHGSDYIHDFYYEQARAEAQRLYGIDWVDLSDPDAVKREGIVILDGQQYISNKGNMTLKYKTTSSKTLDILYVFSG